MLNINALCIQCAWVFALVLRKNIPQNEQKHIGYAVLGFKLFEHMWAMQLHHMRREISVNR